MKLATICVLLSYLNDNGNLFSSNLLHFRNLFD